MTSAVRAQPSVTPLAHVEERGDGPIEVILIPGLSCDWRVFDAFMTRNQSRYHMLAVTLPGFGSSDAPPLAKDSTPADGAWLNNAEAAVVKLVRERKLDKPIVMGHSLGGHLAMRLALHRPELFRAAISLDGLPRFPPPAPGQPDSPDALAARVKMMQAMLATLPDERWAEMQKAGVANLVTDPVRAKALGEMCASVPRATTVRYMLETMSSDLRARVPHVTIPLLTISAISLESGPEPAKRIEDSIRSQFKAAPPNVRLVFVEGSRHFVMDDRPADVDQIVRDFLAGKEVHDVPATMPATAPAASPTTRAIHSH